MFEMIALIVLIVLFSSGGTSESNSGDYWASDYGDDGGFGE